MTNKNYYFTKTLENGNEIDILVSVNGYSITMTRFTNGIKEWCLNICDTFTNVQTKLLRKGFVKL